MISAAANASMYPDTTHSSWVALACMCHPDAVAAVRAAWQVAIIDPGWGRNTILWPCSAISPHGHAPQTDGA